MTDDINDFLTRYGGATHEGFQGMKAEVRAQHALRRAGRVQSAYMVGQEAARAGMPRRCPIDGPDAAGLCAAFLEGFDAARLEMQQQAYLAALRRNSNGG